MNLAKAILACLAFSAISTACTSVHAQHLRSSRKQRQELSKTNEEAGTAATSSTRNLQHSTTRGVCHFDGETREPGGWLLGPSHTCLCDKGGTTRWVDCVENGQVQAAVNDTPDPNTALGRRRQFQPKDFVFDLLGSVPESISAAGTIQPLTVEGLPSLAGQGVSYSLFSIEPCGINLPHSHPRATELLYVIDGQDLRTGFVEENGGRVIVNDIGKGDVTFFPEGLIHYQQNLSCERATYISALNSEDPGVVTVTTQFFQLPEEALAASLNRGPSQVSKLIEGLPVGPAQGRQECLNKCGISSKVW